MSTFNSNYKYSLLTDFYQLSMANAYFNSGVSETKVVYDLFFRSIPKNTGFMIFAGLEQMIDEIRNFSFSEDDIAYLKSSYNFSKEFLDYLSNFKFQGDIYALPEGTPIFANEPIITVKANLIEAGLIESLLTISIAQQTFVATKINRIVRASAGRDIYEFSTRMAHSFDSALYCSRAAYIGGATATSNVMANREYNIPLVGTINHNYVQMFDSELDAFKTFALNNPDSCILTVDTYNVLKSGIPNAIRAFNETLVPIGKRPKGILISSGDITYLSKQARIMLDEAGFTDCEIITANELDEKLIRDIIYQGAKIDGFGVGESIVQSEPELQFPLAYKLVAIIDGDKTINKLKISQNTKKITTPGFKSIWRLFDRDSGKAMADLITFTDEEIDDSTPLEIFDPEHLWKSKVLDNYLARKMHKQIFKDGELIYKIPTVKQIRKYTVSQLSTIWEELQRFENPHKYYVDLSKRLWTVREKLLSELANYKGEVSGK